MLYCNILPKIGQQNSIQRLLIAVPNPTKIGRQVINLKRVFIFVCWVTTAVCAIMAGHGICCVRVRGRSTRRRRVRDIDSTCRPRICCMVAASLCLSDGVSAHIYIGFHSFSIDFFQIKYIEIIFGHLCFYLWPRTWASVQYCYTVASVTLAVPRPHNYRARHDDVKRRSRKHASKYRLKNY